MINSNRLKNAESPYNEKKRETDKKTALNQKGTQSVHRTVSLLNAVAKYNDQGANLSKNLKFMLLVDAIVRRFLY